jgi:hypothetical protein
MAERDRARTKERYRRVLCLLLREAAHLKPREIALALGMQPASDTRLQAQFAREGEAMFLRPGRGGARRRHLASGEERVLLKSLMMAGRPNLAVPFPVIQREYERRVGHAVHAAVIYRMLRRHGWRTIMLDSIAPPRGWAASNLPR